jgi:hypothetical protein
VTQQSRAPVRLIVISIIAALLALLIVLVTIMWRRESDLAAKVANVEASVAQAASGHVGDAQSMRANLAATSAQSAALRAAIPFDIEPGVFDQVAQVAMQNGIVDFRYQRKSEYTTTMQAGIWKVYRYTIWARGSQAQLVSFMSGIYNISGPTTVIDTMLLSALSPDWQMTADVLIYTLP